mmetsp:Transcript_16586/g.39381  ORF Transcript_16586/g.39381 Transcript_16586/m.39381 type:complete len:96 (-) Transcript_16586:241-528(-)
MVCLSKLAHAIRRLALSTASGETGQPGVGAALRVMKALRKGAEKLQFGLILGVPHARAVRTQIEVVTTQHVRSIVNGQIGLHGAIAQHLAILGFF